MYKLLDFLLLWSFWFVKSGEKMQYHIFSFKEAQLPQGFQYHHTVPKNDDEEYILRANLKDRKDITHWIREFGAATSTQWNVKRTREGCTKLFIEFVCHHSSFMKVPKDENGCNKRGISKNASCLARIRIGTNVIRSKRSRDQFARIGLWAKIRISKQHTHTLNTAQTLRFLQSKNSTLRETFFEYFSNNMIASQAKKFHELELTMKNATEADFANGNINPTSDTVKYWFSQWHTLKGSKSDSELISELNEKKTSDASKNNILELEEDSPCVPLSTPHMQGAHALVSSKELSSENLKTEHDYEKDNFSNFEHFKSCIKKNECIFNEDRKWSMQYFEKEVIFINCELHPVPRIQCSAIVNENVSICVFNDVTELKKIASIDFPANVRNIFHLDVILKKLLLYCAKNSKN